MKKDEGLVICLSGRGDKDVEYKTLYGRGVNNGSRKMKAAFENGKKAFIPYVMGGDGGLEKLKKEFVF